MSCCEFKKLEKMFCPFCFELPTMSTSQFISKEKDQKRNWQINIGSRYEYQTHSAKIIFYHGVNYVMLHHWYYHSPILIGHQTWEWYFVIIFYRCFLQFGTLDLVLGASALMLNFKNLQNISIPLKFNLLRNQTTEIEKVEFVIWQGFAFACLSWWSTLSGQQFHSLLGNL